MAYDQSILESCDRTFSALRTPLSSAKWAMWRQAASSGFFLSFWSPQLGTVVVARVDWGSVLVPSWDSRLIIDESAIPACPYRLFHRCSSRLTRANVTSVGGVSSRGEWRDQARLGSRLISDTRTSCWGSNNRPSTMCLVTFPIWHPRIFAGMAEARVAPPSTPTDEKVPRPWLLAISSLLAPQDARAT